MAKQGENKKIGRPQKEINKDQFESLCRLQCTRLEICEVTGVSEDTIERWCKRTYGETFAVVFSQKRTGGFVSLRRTQFKLADKSAAMAIFLGKNYLGQADKQEMEHSGTVNWTALSQAATTGKNLTDDDK